MVFSHPVLAVYVLCRLSLTRVILFATENASQEPNALVPRPLELSLFVLRSCTGHGVVPQRSGDDHRE